VSNHPDGFSRRAVIGLLAAASAHPLPAFSQGAPAEEIASCLPPVLYASAPSRVAIDAQKAEIAREGAKQQTYFVGAEKLLASLGVAASRLCAALELPLPHRPDIILAESQAWRTVDRHFSGRDKEVVMLSKSDTIVKGQAPSGDNMLFAILAHELGHAFQFSRCFDQGDTSFIGSGGIVRPLREIELHADYMAGFSLARAEERYGRPEDLLRRFSDTILRLGDNFNFKPCIHHGTPAERYTMMMKGYIEAQRSPTLGAPDASKLGIALLDDQLRPPQAGLAGDAACK
jgi:hypothetical protein